MRVIYGGVLPWRWSMRTLVLNASFEPGPALGETLAAAESLWIDSRFSLDREELLGGSIANVNGLEQATSPNAT